MGNTYSFGYPLENNAGASGSGDGLVRSDDAVARRPSNPDMERGGKGAEKSGNPTGITSASAPDLFVRTACVEPKKQGVQEVRDRREREGAVEEAMDSPASSTSQEESFYSWRRKSDEEGKGRAKVPAYIKEKYIEDDAQGRYSLASTIPLEDVLPAGPAEVVSSETADRSPTSKHDAPSYGDMLQKYQQFEFPNMDLMRSNASEASTVPQQHDKPVLVHPGSLSSGTRSVGSGGSQSTRSPKDSHRRGSMDEEFAGGQHGGVLEGYHGGNHVERRAGSTSARSSMTLERTDARANRSSFEAFQKALQKQEAQQRRLQALCEADMSREDSNVFRDSQNVQDYEEYPKDVEFLMALGVPKELCRDAWMLAVLPADSPAPARMLSKLWNRSVDDTQSCMVSLSDLGVMSVAQLGGQLWGLPRERFTQQLQLHLVQERPIVSFHRCLINGYAREAWLKRAAMSNMSAMREEQDRGEEPPDAADWEREEREEREWEEPQYLIHDGQMLALLLASVEDDGYIVTNLVYHLVGARLDGVVRRLLLNPLWLERKLMLSRSSTSTDASLIVADFRRYLMMYADNDVKLVLEAVQLSMSALKQNPVPGLLQTQVTGRLITAPLIVREPWMQVKYHTSALSMGMGMHMPMSVTNGKESIVALPVLNPCLDQAGGVQRSCLKCGHDRPTSRNSGGSVSSVASVSSKSSAGSSVSISGYVSVSHVAVVPTMNGAMEAVSAASNGSLTIWDLEIGDSVDILWAHQGPITGLAVTADGSLVVSASSDGMVRAYAVENGVVLRSFGTSKNPVVHMVLDPHGRFVVTAGPRGELVTWDLVSARAVHTYQTNSKVTCLVLSPCTKYAVAGTEDGDILGTSVDTGAAQFMLKGHTSAVTQIVATPGCKKIFSSSHDRDLRAWYGVTGSSSTSRTSDTMSNSGSVVSLHLTKDYKTALCGLDTGNTTIWDVETRKCKVVLEGGHAGPVTCITMSHDEKTVLTGGYDGTTIVWSLEGNFLRVLEGHSGAITSLSTLSRNGFAITGSEDGSVRVWDTKASESHTAHWHSGIVRKVACGRSGIAVSVGDDCIARVWNTGLGEHLRSYLKHKSSIRWCAQSEDGYRILTASPDRQLSVWDPRTGHMLYGVEAKSGSRVKAFSAASDLTAAVSCLFDSTVECWDLVSGSVSWVIQKAGQKEVKGQQTGHTSAVNEVLMTTDGQLVITASKDGTARIWDVINRRCKHVLAGHDDSVVGIELEQASKTLVTYSLDHSLIVWDLESGKRISRAKFKSPITCTALSMNGKVAVALSNGCVNLIDLHSGDIREISRLHRGDNTGLDFSREGNFLISSSWDCSIKVVDLSRGCVRGVVVVDSPVTCFALDQESKHLVAGTDRGTVAFVDMGALL